LRNILTPNAAMEAGYRMFRVELKDGDVLDGLLVLQDNESIILRRPNSEDQAMTRLMQIIRAVKAWALTVENRLLKAYLAPQLEGLRLFAIARPTSGRNSFTTPKPTFVAMEIPKLTAPSPTECWLDGCHKRDTKAPAATPPICETERCRLPLSLRASTPLAIAYPARGQNPSLPELK
jgi:hypothetical protein